MQSKAVQRFKILCSDFWGMVPGMFTILINLGGHAPLYALDPGEDLVNDSRPKSSS